MPSWALLAGPWQLARVQGKHGVETGGQPPRRVRRVGSETSARAPNALGSSAQGEGRGDSSKYACIISVWW
jgi:hypothetical protein